MPHQPLAQRYRPQTFQDLLGQGDVVQVLSGAIESEQIAPAYLFTGIRGTGKTSSARIFAKSLNCAQVDRPTIAPCGVCDVCQSIARGDSLDVVEIDAASNTGVDNMRELLERSHYVPLQCRYKVFLIDEAHMLSTAAFNAMLKTLEEPPRHVVFVLATTDVQRLLPTIVSRCQRFDFRGIDAALIQTALAAIAQQEGITIAPDALQFIAQRAKGGLRDATNLLEQARLLAPITLESLQRLVGALPETTLLSLVRCFIEPEAGSVATALDLCDALLGQGHQPSELLAGLVQVLVDLQVALQAPTRPDLATYGTLWESLRDLTTHVSVLQVQVLSNQLRATANLVRYSEQGALWLKRLVLDLLPSDAPVPVAAVTRPSLAAQWVSVVALLPANLRPLIAQGQLTCLEDGVATITYVSAMFSSIAQSQTSALEQALEAAGCGSVKVTIES